MQASLVSRSAPGALSDDDLVAGVGDRLDDQRLGRAGDIHDRIDMLGVEPVAGDRGGAVGAVLVIGDDDLDRRAEHLAAKILDRHLRRGRAAVPGQLRNRGPTCRGSARS